MFASDVYGVVLGYYDNDYSAIKTVGGPLKPFELAYAGSDFDGASDGLYNGNIKNATVSLRRKIYYGDTDVSMSPIGYAYTYDQLNRYVKMRAYNNYDTATNEWQSGGAALQDYAETVSYDGNGNILNYIRHGNPTIGTPTGLTAMDSMTYSYNGHNNQLNSVADGVASSNYTTDIDNEGSNNYAYDKQGNLIQDTSQHLVITWNVRNKVATVNNTKTNLLITFGYDAMGNRVMKKDSNTSTNKCYTTWYIRDAQGNILSTYKEKNDSLYWKEADIYGSSRVGVYYPDSLIYPKANQVNASDTFTMELWEGKRQYELTNHLGNVLTTISDKKLMLASNATPNSGSRNAYGNIVSYQPEVVSISDYYPYGEKIPGRDFTLSNDSIYRYGYNKGSEKDDDVEGKGNEYTTKYREIDVRIAKLWSLDPIKRPDLSMYVLMSDNPIMNVDPNGDDDYFDSNGNFIGSDNRTSTFIRIVDRKDVIWQNNSINPSTQSSLFVDYENSLFKRNLNLGVRTALKVGSYYYFHNFNGTVFGVDYGKYKGRTRLAYHLPGTDNVRLQIENKNGNYSLDDVYNDYNSMINIFAHEDTHRKNDATETNNGLGEDHPEVGLFKGDIDPIGHIEEYIAQIKHQSFTNSKSTQLDNLQQAVVSGIVEQLNEAGKMTNVGYSNDDILAKVYEVNNLLAAKHSHYAIFMDKINNEGTNNVSYTFKVGKIK